MSKILGWIILAAGAWMFLSPQSILGLNQLKWMAHYAFPGETLLGIVVLMVAYYLLNFKPPANAEKHSGH